MGYFYPHMFLPASNWSTRITLRAANWSTQYHVKKQFLIYIGNFIEKFERKFDKK